MQIKILKSTDLSLEQFIDIYRRSGINRPVDDPDRMQRMLHNANLLISAWEENELIGLARGFVDYAWVCYLSDLLVDTGWQNRGVGTALLAAVKEEITDQCQLVLLSAPGALGYYPKTGFEKADHAYYIKRPV